MSSLSELTHLPNDVLRDPEHLKLEPRQRFAADQPDNLAFLSPSILEDDLLLRSGGIDGMGAKECLSQVTKKILGPPTDASLFEVPELTCTHLGYGKKSENKDGKAALTKEEGEYWLKALDFREFGEAEAEGIEVTPEDIETASSGLKIAGKGRLHLLFSIFLMFFEKKTPREEPGAKVGLNKVSDFLMFWTLPFQLHFSHRKVQEIIACGKSRIGDTYSIETVSTCAKQIIRDACEQMMHKYDHFIETWKLIFRESGPIEKEYELLADSAGSPIVFVPLQYQVHRMPARLEDFGPSDTRMSLRDEFLQKFVTSREIQKHYFHAIATLPDRQGIDFAFVLPDQKTFEGIVKDTRENGPPNCFFRHEATPIHCRGIQAVRALIESDKKKLTVCFSYLQGIDNASIAKLFRAIGSHYLDHFGITILHGKVCNPKDPVYKISQLHPVSKAMKFDNKHKRSKSKKYPLIFHDRGIFDSVSFPDTYDKWQEELNSQPDIKRLKLQPTYSSEPACVGFFSKCHGSTENCRSLPFPGVTLVQSEQSEDFAAYEYRVVNYDGCVISYIAQCARKNAHALIMALNGYPDKFECAMAQKPEIIRCIINHFIRAVVVADLHLVFERPLPDAEDHEVETACESDEEVESMEDSGIHSGASSYTELGTPDRRPNDEQLLTMAELVNVDWSVMGVHLGVSTNKLDDIRGTSDLRTPKDKAFEVLKVWKRSQASPTLSELERVLRQLGKQGLISCLYQAG